MLRLSFLISLFLATGFRTFGEDGRPNIILIYTDDHGWPDIGAAGIYDDLKTPNIDALAASGVRATNGYSTAPQCVPSRAGLLIGKSQNRFGVESNGADLSGFDAELTIGERLKEAGYATGQIGKWHLGPNDRITEHGFDDVYAKNANRPCHANFTLEGKTVPMGMVDDKIYHLDACSEAALAFIRRHEKEPFFLYLAYRAPHVPLDAPEKYLKRFPGEMPERRRQALAMLSSMDDGIGKITAELKGRGLEEKTLIFYIGDNGAPLKIHKHDAPGGGPGWDGSLNKPMNGEKGMLAEGGIRVPFVISWPGTIPGGQVYGEPVISLDVAATAVELAGLESDEALDGVNLIPFLKGENKAAPHGTLAWRWVSQAAIREGKWKLLRGGNREYLYDLNEDMGETNNVLASHPEVAKRLREKLEEWAGEMKPPGLNEGEMAGVWSAYFDYYLEGKPAPRLAGSLAKGEESVSGWVARGGTLAIRGGALRVSPVKGGPKTQRTFLATNGLDWQGPLKAKIRLQSERGGPAGFAWRKDGQKDFAKGQESAVETRGGDAIREYEVEIPDDGKVIHLRLLLPPGEVAIEAVEFFDGEGKRLRRWRFGPK